MSEANSPIASEEVIDAIVEILRPIGLTLDYDFRDHFRNPKNWTFGAFEWTERLHGVRYFFNQNREGKLASGVILEIGWNPYGAEQIAEGTRKLQELLAS